MSSGYCICYLDQELFSVMCACWHDIPWSFMYLGDTVFNPYTVKFPADGHVDLPFDREYTRHCNVFQIGGDIHVSVPLWPEHQFDSALAREVTLGKFIHLLTTTCFCIPSCQKGWYNYECLPHSVVMSTQRLYYTCTYGELTMVQKGELIFLPLFTSISANTHTLHPCPHPFPLPPQLCSLARVPHPQTLHPKTWLIISSWFTSENIHTITLELKIMNIGRRNKKQTKTGNVKTTQEIKHYWWKSDY